jgi:hypothetical protein
MSVSFTISTTDTAMMIWKMTLKMPRRIAVHPVLDPADHQYRHLHHHVMMMMMMMMMMKMTTMIGLICQSIRL